MSYLSKEVLDGLRSAERRGLGRKHRLRIQVDGKTYPILDLWDDGFAIAADVAPTLRGYVDLYDGARQMAQCLIMRADEDGDVLTYTFKWRTEVFASPPVDFERDPETPVAYLR
ncbi:MAG: hypothetical protein WD046_00685 [Paracoccaceae bacterium]